MTKLLQSLYTYAYENRLVYSQEDRLKIKESNRISEQTRKQLTEMLSANGLELFECYIEEEQLIQGLELEAIFCAGLTIGMELSRL